MQQYGASSGLTAVLAGPFGSVDATAKLLEITLAKDSWKGAQSPFSQVVEAEGISINSRVDLQPDLQQLEEFRNRGIALMAENDGGIVTVYAIGAKPAADCTVQATAVEVTA